jgi:large-conductance mechanosensitive channel
MHEGIKNLLVQILYQFLIKGIVSKLTVKILDVPKMWQNERLQQKNDYKYCRMITNTVDMIIITKLI